MTIKTVGLLMFFLIISNCSKIEMNNNMVTIDRLIKKDTVVTYLRKNNQKFVGKESYNQDKKRTVFIDYYKKECKDCRDFNELYDYYQANTIIDKSDSLLIKISIEGGLSGSGFFIKYKNKRFNISPFTFNDQSGTRFSGYRSILQNVILDKENFKIGDSIYGKINFEIIEDNKVRGEVKHQFKGYFATVVNKTWN